MYEDYKARAESYISELEEELEKKDTLIFDLRNALDLVRYENKRLCSKIIEYEQASYQQVKSGEFTESCSDKQIIENCISLMDELVSKFEDYLEFINFLPEDEEETFSTSFSYFHIIQKLLLWGTNHSGGTSTRQKCKELGYDSTEGVIFKDKRYEADF